MSAIFNFQSLLSVILLLICTCAYLRSFFPSIMDRNKTGSDQEHFFSSSDEEVLTKKKPKTTKTSTKKTTKRGSSSTETKTVNKKAKPTIEELLDAFTDGEDELSTSQPPAQTLSSTYTKKVTNGNITRTVKKEGDLYFVLKVYESKTLKNVDPKEWWTKAHSSLKFQLNYDEPEWQLLTGLIKSAKKKITGKTVFYPNKNSSV